MSHNLSRPPWKHSALLLILLTHAVFGSPIVPTVGPNNESLEVASQTDLDAKSVQASLEEDIFGPTLDERSNRKKRLFYETLKKAKKAKNLALLQVASDTAKSVFQSVFKNVVTLGIKFVIFNFLYAKVNQVLDFKTRVLNNFETKNREQNSEALSTSNDINTAASNTRTTTVVPPEVEVSTFNPDKVSLNLPGTLFATGFSVISAAASVLENLVQHSAVRVSGVLEALKPLIQSSSMDRLPSKKRETDSESKSDSVNADKSPKTPIKNSFVALTQR